MDTITITRKQFNKVVSRCNADFKRITGEHDAEDESGKDALTTLLMMAQNVAFAAAMEFELFDATTNKEDK